MSFFELLDGILTELDIPFFEGQPEFSDDVPAAFLTYSVYEVPNLFGDGTEKTTVYHVTLNCFAAGIDRATVVDNMTAALTTLLIDNGFLRQGGSYTMTDDFPGYYRKIVEFSYDYDFESDKGEI